jgi:outer membrane protein OmpA-like peptidoglycan-associated protein
MPMAIKKIVLHASQANFTDLSVQPNFSTGIQSIEGTVVGLTSKENSRAKVDIHGAVDAFSPVSITGEVNVLSAALYTDLAMSFRNMELTIFNPYSGKFAGYNITKGKLTTELHYKVEGRKLDAQHHITVDQLEFGDKTESKDAVSLPIKLAVALLKDRNGVIDLNIPVTGTLDDPSFRLGPIIWKVFVNILEKAVTAPFALLGALFGGGPDLQFIDFQPGIADLDAGASDKVRNMVKALNERPQLKIEVPIAAVSELDRPALMEAEFRRQVREAQAGKAGRKKSADPAPEFDQLDPASKVEVLMQLYAKNVGGEPKFPDAVTSIKAKPELAATQADFLEKELHQHITVADSDLTELGQQRAMAVQQALLTDTQLDPARVFLVENDKAKNQDGRVRLELSLK